MRFFIVIIAFFLTGNIFGQIERQPLNGNPILKALNQENVDKRIEFINKHSIRKISIGDFRDTEIFFQKHLVNGDTLSFKIDTSGFKNGGVFSILQNPGNTVLDTTQLTYIPENAILWREDTISIKTCDTNGDCDTLIYPILVRRPNMSIDGGATLVDAYQITELCFEDYIDTDDFKSSDFGDCDVSDFRTEVSLADNCLLYEAGGSTDIDEICVVICSDHRICDTVKFDVSVYQDTITTLPFFDDFSNEGPYTLKSNWVTHDAFVNTGLAINPPSIGTASFDGVADNGNAYGSSFGISDYLTSKYIDISNYVSNDGLNLVFFLQPGGYAYDKPDAKDHFLLEFKDADGKWEVQGEWSSEDNIFQSEEFIKMVVPINKSQFIHDGFQFRFTNLSDRTGIVDVWNLDYVLLDKIDGDSEIKDVAFTKSPKSVLEHYYHMPFNQFVGNEDKEVANKIEIGMFNHFLVEVAAEPSTLNVIDIVTGARVLDDAELLVLDGSVNQRNIAAQKGVNYTNDLLGRSILISNIKSELSGQDSVVLEMSYHFEQTQETNIFEFNNTVSSLTYLTDFFAYDDGSAESGILAKGSGTEVLMKFHANVGDSIRSVQYFIPHVKNNVSNQRFKIKIWTDLDGDLLFESAPVNVIYANNFTGAIASFTNYALKDAETGQDAPVFIPAGDFYVGWEQVSNEFNNAIPMGFDESNPYPSVKKWREKGGTWEDFPLSLKGALMIRPVFGIKTIPTTSVHDVANVIDVEVYPNPSNGLIHINTEGQFSDYQFELLNSLGQRIQSGNLSPVLDFTGERNGIYFLQILNTTTGNIVSKKLIKG